MYGRKADAIIQVETFMKITTKAVYDMASWTLEHWEGYEYSGPIEDCKGEGTAKDQLKLQNKIAQDQLDQQKAIRDQILQATSKYTTGSGEGYDPAQFAAMISRFLNQNSANFNAAGSSVRSALASRGAGGGDMPVGGDFVRGISTLEGAKASSQSQGILGANIDNLTQALNNRFNALNVQSGQSAQIGQNVGTFNRGASDALDAYVRGANAPGFGTAFSTAFGGALGKAAAGGIGTSIGIPQQNG